MLDKAQLVNNLLKHFDGLRRAVVSHQEIVDMGMYDAQHLATHTFLKATPRIDFDLSDIPEGGAECVIERAPMPPPPGNAPAPRRPFDEQVAMRPKLTKLQCPRAIGTTRAWARGLLERGRCCDGELCGTWQAGMPTLLLQGQTWQQL